MTRLPSHDRALARALQLEAWARAIQFDAETYRKIGAPFDTAQADERVALLTEVAGWCHWLAGHAPRLAELEVPIRPPNSYGGKR